MYIEEKNEKIVTNFEVEDVLFKKKTYQFQFSKAPFHPLKMKILSLLPSICSEFEA